jgi:hypothetical protein
VGPAFALRLPPVGLLLLRSNRGYLQEQSKTPGGAPLATATDKGPILGRKISYKICLV